MGLLIENKEKVMDNYLLNLKFIVSFCIDLPYFLYYRIDLHCGVSGDWGGKVSRFVPLLVSFSVMSTRPQKEIYQKVIIKFGVRYFQNKRQISYHHGNHFLY